VIAMPPTKSRAAGAVAERERLEAEQVNVIEARDTVTARASELRRQIAAADEQAAADRAIAARAGQSPAAGSSPERVAMTVELQQQQAAARELGAVAARIPEEVVRLHRERWDDFAEHAEAATHDALRTFEELEEAYRAAHDAWQAARAAWEEPMGDLDPRDDAADLPGRLGQSIGLGNGPRSVPDWPLPSPADVFTAGATDPPRPLGFVPPSRRAAQGRPGTFRDVSSDGVAVIAENPQASAVYTTCDLRGFARYVRMED